MLNKSIFTIHIIYLVSTSQDRMPQKVGWCESGWTDGWWWLFDLDTYVHPLKHIFVSKTNLFMQLNIY